MEIGLQEWSIIAGVLILVGISLDGLRRSIRAKRSELRMSSNLTRGMSSHDPLDDVSTELPSGGARVVGRESAIDTHSSALGAYEDEVPTLSSKVDNFETVDVEPSPVPGHNLKSSNEVLTLFVRANSGEQFSGHKLVEALLNAGVNYGAMNIFHAHYERELLNEVSFSVANMKEPGFFDLDELDSFSTPGLVFFMSLPAEHPFDALKAMVNSAQSCANALGGKVYDNNMSIFIEQTKNHYEEQINQFNRQRSEKYSEE